MPKYGFLFINIRALLCVTVPAFVNRVHKPGIEYQSILHGELEFQKYDLQQKEYLCQTIENTQEKDISENVFLFWF